MKVESPQKVLCISLLVALLYQSGAPGPSEYKNAAGFRVVVSPVGKSSGNPSSESKLDFFGPGGQRLCALDYSSEDGQHGFGVAKAEWTPDQSFFVFSLVSSGGHQPWHAPTFFFGLHEQAIRNLDNYTSAAGISKRAFELRSPNIVLTEVWREERPVPAKFRLDSLNDTELQSKRILRCTGGRNFPVDSYETQIP